MLFKLFCNDSFFLSKFIKLSRQECRFTVLHVLYHISYSLFNSQFFIQQLLADIIISGDKSEWKRAIQEYVDQGKSESEAFGLVLAENAAQIGLDALGGILSGAAIGGGTYAGTSLASHFNYGKDAKNKNYTQKLVAEGIELNPDSKYVQKAQRSVRKKEEL